MSALRMPRVATVQFKPWKTKGWGRVAFLVVTSVLMLVPMYLLVVSAFKSQQDILAHPFSLSPDQLTTEYLRKAATNPDFNILKGYAVTILFVVR